MRDAPRPGRSSYQDSLGFLVLRRCCYAARAQPTARKAKTGFISVTRRCQRTETVRDFSPLSRSLALSRLIRMKLK